MRSSPVFIFVGLCLGLSFSAILPRKLGEVKLEFSAFLQIFQEHHSQNEAPFDPDQFTLLVSTFDAYNFFKTDKKYYLRGPGKYLKNITALSEAITLLDETAFWPNDPDFVEEQVFGYEAVAWPSGFLVPGKTKGQLEIYNFRNFSQPPVNIASLDTLNWYYHRTVFFDVNGDGFIDAVTARFQTPTVTNPIRGQLVWFENPGGPLRSDWNQHVLVTDGPDVHFRRLQITNSGNVTYDCFLASEFWNEQIILYCVPDAPTAWTNTSNIIKVPVDLTAGQAFDCLVGDFNKDGVLDLLATIYNTEIEEGFAVAYEVPSTFPEGNFTRHVIASGFEANQIVAGDSMSPGSAKMFYRHVSESGSKPSLMLSGDDDGRHYILTPLSEDSSDWTYSKDILVDTNMTTAGKFAVEDLDGDGWSEIIAAGYSSGTLYIYTFAPQLSY